MTEVIVIVFLVAIGTIGVAGLFGDNIRSLFGTSSEAVAGNTSAANTGKETTRTKWNLKGGSLSAYSGFNPGGTPNSANPGGGTNGGFNPGATPNSAGPGPGGGFNPGGGLNSSNGGVEVGP
jgi:Flp pilus assembly pilin Flp